MGGMTLAPGQVRTDGKSTWRIVRLAAGFAWIISEPPRQREIAIPVNAQTLGRHRLADATSTTRSRDFGN